MRRVLVASLILLSLASSALADKVAIIQMQGHANTYYPIYPDETCAALEQMFERHGPFTTVLHEEDYEGISGLVISIQCRETIGRPMEGPDGYREDR